MKKIILFLLAVVLTISCNKEDDIVPYKHSDYYGFWQCEEYPSLRVCFKNQFLFQIFNGSSHQHGIFEEAEAYDGSFLILYFCKGDPAEKDHACYGFSFNSERFDVRWLNDDHSRLRFGGRDYRLIESYIQK